MEQTIVRLLRSGRMTIPPEFRAQLGIRADTLLRVSVVDGELRIRPVEVVQTVAGSPWVKELYDYFAPVREEAAGCTDLEIKQAIDEAVNSARAQAIHVDP